MTLRQKEYVADILDRFGMSDCRPAATPIEVGMKLTKSSTWSSDESEKPPYRELVGALMYLSVATRPDISHAVNALSQYNDSFGKEHWQAAKRVLRYMKGTPDIGITFGNNTENLIGYADADWAACVDDRRSSTGFAFTMNGGAVSWESRKQQTVALSSTEAEYMALTEASKEAMHLQRLTEEMTIANSLTVLLLNDNIGSQRLAGNPVFHSRTKHIHVQHHFVREALASGEIQLNYLPTDEMPADVLTKGLSRVKHRRCLDKFGVREMDRAHRFSLREEVL